MSIFKKLRSRREKVFGLVWESRPSRIGYTVDIENMAKSLNRQYRKDKVDQVRKARVQYLQYGMAQLVLWQAHIV